MTQARRHRRKREAGGGIGESGKMSQGGLSGGVKLSMWALDLQPWMRQRLSRFWSQAGREEKMLHYEIWEYC